MWRLGGWVARGIGLAAGMATALADAQQLVGAPTVEVNTFTPGWQLTPDVAAESSGGFIVTWWSRPKFGEPAQDGSADGVFLRAFDASGSPHGPEVLVPETGRGSQCRPRVAIGPDGNAIVTWLESDWEYCSGVPTAHARRFDGAGNALGGTTPLLEGSAAAIGFDGAGDAFGLVCSSEALQIAALAEGAAATDRVTVEEGARSCELAGVPDGGGIATWADNLTFPPELWLASFDADLNVGVPQLVVARSVGHDVAVSPTGRVMVVWSAPDGRDAPGELPYYQFGVFGQLFDTTGTPLTGAFLVNAARVGNQLFPAIASDGKGRFLVSWMNGLGPEPVRVPGRNPNGVNARLFDDDGTPLGSEFAVHLDPDAAGYQSRVDGTAAGDFVVAWEGGRQQGETGGGYLDVFARRLAAVPCSSSQACDDGDACTIDGCEGGICIGRSIPGCCRVDAECDDVDPCTTDACAAGTCVNQADPSCVPCQYQHTCYDGDGRTREWCSGGRCIWTTIQPCQDDSDCVDDDGCTLDYCSQSEDGCYNVPIIGCERCASDADCTDWRGCTADRCVDGACEFTPVAACAACAFSADCESGCLLGPDTCIENACVPAAGCPIVVPREDPADAAARFQIELRHPGREGSALISGRPLRVKVRLVLAEDAGGRRCRAGTRAGGIRGQALPGGTTMIEVGLGRRGARCLAQAGDLALEARVVMKAGRRRLMRRTYPVHWHDG